MAAVDERRFRLACGLELAARVHHAGAPVRVLAVHGWLDNAASFDALAAHLPDCEIVAVDLIGHGRSDHRPAGAWYHNVDYPGELLELLDLLGWRRSVWLGHSLGGAVLALLAAACPERVERLLLIESAGLISAAPEAGVEQLRRGLTERARHQAGRPRRVPVSLEQAIAARRRVNGLSEAAARALVERGTRAVEGGHVWSSDARLLLASPVRIGEAQVRALLAAIQCPVQLLVADPPMPYVVEADLHERLASLRDAELHRFPGHHHLHMETPEALAPAMRHFLRRSGDERP